LLQIAQMRDPNDYLSETVQYQGKKPWRIHRSGPDFLLTFAHPGGGGVEINLTANEAAELAEDLKSF
jgi:hypothetical protein